MQRPSRRPRLPRERQLRALLAALPGDLEQFARAGHSVDDWRGLLAAALDHGVAGVLLSGLRRVPAGCEPRVMEEAERQLTLDALLQDVHRDTLRAVLSALAKAGVPALALKGPLLAARLYDDDAVRPSSDLDVLVDATTLDAAATALAPLGYDLQGGDTGRFFRDHHHHVHAIHRVHEAIPVVELHFDAYRGFGTSLPAGPLLGRSIPCGIAGWGEARVLAPEDEFLYLAVHAASHRFERLGWLYDLKLLLTRHPDLAWERIAARAEADGLMAVASFACGLLSAWLGVTIGGDTHLPPLGKSRSHLAEVLARPLSSHVANAAAAFLFSAVLCDDPSRAAAFVGRFVRIKVLHEAPLRARAHFAS